jgi:uncharacterized DUF497 family protein
LKLRGIIWHDEIVDKLRRKHHVERHEVEEVLMHNPQFRLVEKGHQPGENVYAALGQTDSGRYMTIFFVCKKGGRGLILSARGMTGAERRRYERR